MNARAIITSLSLLFILSPVVLKAAPALSGITANADSAETVTNNPAGMSRLEKPSGYVNPLIIYMNSKDETSTSTGLVQGKTESDNSLMALPGMYYAHPLNDTWAVGIGTYSAMGLGATFNDDWAGRYLVQNWSLVFAGVAPSVSYRINEKLSVGGSLPVMYSRYSLEKAVVNDPTTAPDGKFKLIADGWGVGWMFGVLYEFTGATRVGFNYRSKVSVTVEGNPDYSGLTSSREVLLNTYGALNKDISLTTSTPQIVNIGVYHEFESGWSFSLDGVWVDFSEFGMEDVTIGSTEVNTASVKCQDIWAAILGVDYRLTPRWTLTGGAFYVSPPMKEKDRTASMRLDRMYGIGFGFEYNYWEDWTVAVDLTYIQLGKQEYSSPTIPAIGEVKGKYTTNYGILLGIGLKF